MPIQSSDGLAHFTYYDSISQLSFVWDGHSDMFEISHGGYGEPVIAKSIAPDPSKESTPFQAIVRFEILCKAYAKAYREGLLT